MKTAERILVTSLELFNQHGEHNVSSVDIALEMDISPGNLYYHFKGKEIIVQALFELHQSRLQQLLSAHVNQPLSIEDFFYFLYLLLEQTRLFRFFYRNLSDMSEKYPAISKGFRKLNQSLNHCIEQLLEQFYQQKGLRANAAQRRQMVDLIGLVFSQGSNYYAIQGKEMSDDDYIYKTLACILFALVPYMSLEPSQLRDIERAIEGHSMGGNTE